MQKLTRKRSGLFLWAIVEHMQTLSDDERALLTRLASLPDEQRERLFEVATMPVQDWAVIRGIPSSKTFWLGVASAVGVFGAVVGWLLSWVGFDGLSKALGNHP